MAAGVQLWTASVRIMAQAGDLEPVDKDAATYAWQQIVRQILALIADGTWPAGSRMPSEGDLGHELDAARGTVRKALAWLAEYGVIVTRPGRGTFVADPLPTPLPDPPG